MYLFEIIVKIFKGKDYYNREGYDPFKYEELNQDESCEHIFLPIDSSGEMLACSKCGFLVNRNDLKDENIFKR